MDHPAVHSALASPVRRRLLDVLRGAGAAEPPTAQLLAARLGLHVTTVRFHLDQLEGAGLVVRRTGHAPRRGRPAVHYVAADPGPDADAEAQAAREQMIEALAQALADEGPAGPERSLAAGRRWADRLAPVHEGPAPTLPQALARLGFDPEPAGDVIRLRACPFRAAARRHPEVVCQVHLGLAQRLAERAAGPGPVQVRLIPFVEPDLCLVTLVRQDAPAATTPRQPRTVPAPAPPRSTP